MIITSLEAHISNFLRYQCYNQSMSRYKFGFKVTRSYDELLKWVFDKVKNYFDVCLFRFYDIDIDEVTLSKEEKYKYLDEFIEDEIKTDFEVLDDNHTIAEKRTELVFESLKEDIIKLQQGQDIIDEFNSRKPKF